MSDATHVIPPRPAPANSPPTLAADPLDAPVAPPHPIASASTAGALPAPGLVASARSGGLRLLSPALLLLAAALLLFGVPALYGAGALSITSVNQLGRFLAVAVVALGIDMVWGYAGILTLCQAMFFCFGGYAIGMHMALHGPLDERGVPKALSVVVSTVGGIPLPDFWKPFTGLLPAVGLGVLLPGLFAYVFGYFAFRSRVRGVYFSIITQATTYAAQLVFSKNEMLLCGTNGLLNFVTLAGFDLSKESTKLGLYWLSAVTLVLAYLLCRFLVASRAGRLLIAVRDNESRLRFAGFQPVTFKVFVFVLGAVLAAVGGMLYTPQNGIITPYKMAPAESITLVVLVAVGGRGTLSGAVVGALLVSYLQSYLTTRAPQAWPFVLGGLFVAVTLFAPDGIVGAWRKLLDRLSPAPRPPSESEAA
jgi:urea transport system permease protein